LPCSLAGTFGIAIWRASSKPVSSPPLKWVPSFFHFRPFYCKDSLHASRIITGADQLAMWSLGREVKVIRPPICIQGCGIKVSLSFTLVFKTPIDMHKAAQSQHCP
jgi:hypothetical protein